MKNLLLIIALVSVSFGFAQTEKANYKEVVVTFENHYNNGDYESIYNMFDANLKKTLTLEKTKKFFKSDINAEALGKIKAVKLNKIVRTAHSYTMTLENRTCEVFFLLNENNKISGFQMSPQTIKQ